MMVDADTAVAAFTERLADLRRRNDAALTAMSSAVATATSQDGAVTVTASADGALVDLELRSPTQPGPALAAVIHQTLTAARSAALESAAGQVAQLVGEDNPAVAVLRRQADQSAGEPGTGAVRTGYTVED